MDEATHVPREALPLDDEPYFVAQLLALGWRLNLEILLENLRLEILQNLSSPLNVDIAQAEHDRVRPLHKSQAIPIRLDVEVPPQPLHSPHELPHLEEMGLK